eukprot:CAMPEP_0119525606 /NCGR_PEP_ID=MMETSP1344-20130328/40366_1 /TAXON_ID=236787 /ORGANISM="Florenciella parvula, Strain CCMP2471" /LENGTH=100 /DNA_ID=CAMNT_0007564415 /DNA_START=82 /DNA_END=385 /DNA_ORIENTATION=-
MTSEAGPALFSSFLLQFKNFPAQLAPPAIRVAAASWRARADTNETEEERRRAQGRRFLCKSGTRNQAEAAVGVPAGADAPGWGRLDGAAAGTVAGEKGAV